MGNNLNKLNIKDKALFNRFLNLSGHELSVYAFENIYIWKALFDIRWVTIGMSLCVFFKDKTGCFLYMPPLGKKIEPQVISEAFEVMDGFNKNKNVSRVENVEAKDIGFYRHLGYKVSPKFCDYLCRRNEVVELKGNKFKSKRSCFNYFINHYRFEYMPFSASYSNDCLKLYGLWKKERQAKVKDPIYQYMLDDSLICLKILLKDYRKLNFVGRLVRINNEVKAFSFGFKLNCNTFCILYEITGLSVKGLAQFIFRRFCLELKGYKYINIMDDSGLENLKRVKVSYHPVRLIPAYIVTRNGIG